MCEYMKYLSLDVIYMIAINDKIQIYIFYKHIAIVYMKETKKHIYELLLLKERLDANFTNISVKFHTDAPNYFPFIVHTSFSDSLMVVNDLLTSSFHSKIKILYNSQKFYPNPNPIYTA